MEVFFKTKDKSYEDMISLKGMTKVSVKIVTNGFIVEYGDYTYVCKDYDELTKIIGNDMCDYIQKNRVSIEGFLNFKGIEYYISKPTELK